MNPARTLPFALFMAACAAQQPVPDVGPSQRQVLTEDQALQVIREALMTEGTTSEADWPLQVEHDELDADVRLDGPFAIEWVSEADRAAHASVLPQGTPNGPLRIITGKSVDAHSAQVLVLDANAYGYEGNPRLVQRGAPGIDEAESRVRRDVAEFLSYAREQEPR
jgi:hypothetical protein